MTRLVSGALGLLALLLLLTLYVEHGLLRSEDDTSALPPRAQLPGLAVAETTMDTDRSLEWAAKTLARPLFNPTRRAPPGTSSAGTANAALPRLSGILVSSSQKRAFFTPVGGGKTIVAGEGAQLGAYVVQSIGGGAVTLMGPGGRIVLRPIFDATPRTATPPPAFAAGVVIPAKELGRPSLLERVLNSPAAPQRPVQ